MGILLIVILGFLLPGWVWSTEAQEGTGCLPGSPEGCLDDPEEDDEDEDECLVSNVERCTESMRNAYGLHDAIAVDNSELHELCRHAQEAIECINLYVSHCLDNKHRALYHYVTEGLQNFISDFCDEDSEFSREYRKHLDCYNKLIDEFKRCSDYMVSGHKQVESTELAPDEAIRILCCHYDQTASCYREVTLRKCSPEASSFVDVILNKLKSNATRKLNCGRFTVDGAGCPCGASSSLIGGFFGRLSFVLMAAFAATWWKCRMSRREDPFAESPSEL